MVKDMNALFGNQARGAALCDHEAPRWYSLYGMPVRSDIHLPIAPMSCPDEAAPAWIFRRVEPARTPVELNEPVVAEARCQHGHVICVMHAGPTGTWIRNPSVATCRIVPGARRVDVYPEPGADERILGFVLAGQMSILVLLELGYPCLHASAIVNERGAVAFPGPHGQGKSTLAACFLKHGAALLTDDALPLRVFDDGVYGGLGLPLMKVWRDTALCTLQLAEELPELMPLTEKKLLALDGRYPFAQAPTRLNAMYILDRYDPFVCGRDDVHIRALSQREGVTALLAQTSWSGLIQPAQGARLLPLYARLVSQTPVHVLSFPNGHQYQEAVYARIMSDLED